MTFDLTSSITKHFQLTRTFIYNDIRNNNYIKLYKTLRVLRIVRLVYFLKEPYQVGNMLMYILQIIK